MLVLDERHQVHVVLAADDEDALAAVTLGVRVLQHIEQVASLDVEDDFLRVARVQQRGLYLQGRGEVAERLKAAVC